MANVSPPPRCKNPCHPVLSVVKTSCVQCCCRPSAFVVHRHCLPPNHASRITDPHQSSYPKIHQSVPGVSQKHPPFPNLCHTRSVTATTMQIGTTTGLRTTGLQDSLSVALWSVVSSSRWPVVSLSPRPSAGGFRPNPGISGHRKSQVMEKSPTPLLRSWSLRPLSVVLLSPVLRPRASGFSFSAFQNFNFSQ